MCPDTWNSLVRHSHSGTLSKDDVAAPRFENKCPKELHLNFIIDATSAEVDSSDLDATIRAFKKIAYDYDGSLHTQSALKVSWPDFEFVCRLQSLNIEYVLFDPSGTPLRAKLKTSFLAHQTEQELERGALSRRSPDLTHVVQVEPSKTDE